MQSLEDLQKEKLRAEINKLKEETEQIKKGYAESSEEEKLKNDKLKEEINKLKEETAQIKKPWVKQSSFWGIIISGLIPILTIFIAYQWGGIGKYVEAQETSIKAENNNLEADKKNLLYDQKILKAQNDTLHKDSIRLFLSYSTDSNRLSEKYLNDSIHLAKKQIADSIKFSEDISFMKKEISTKTQEIKDVNSTLSVKSIELDSVTKKIEEVKYLLPISNIITHLLSTGDFNQDNSFRDTLIHLIDLIKYNYQYSLVNEFINTTLNDSLISKGHFLTKTAILSALYLGTLDEKWKLKLYENINNNFEKYYGGQLMNQDVGTYVGFFNVFVRIFRLENWDKKDRIANIALFSNLIIKMESKDYDFLNFTNDFLTRIAFSQIPLNRNIPINNPNGNSVIDTLWNFTYADNKKAFLLFLKAYRKLNTSKFGPAFNYSFVRLFENHKSYFIYFVNSVVKFYSNHKNMPYVLEKDVIENRTAHSFMEFLKSNIGSRFETDITLWEKYLETNKELFVRMMEDDFVTYQNDISLLTEDFN